ncbi:MAG: adenylate/guanylate cyclase domain-containing protein [Gaiellaceae bacterium]
MAVSRRTVTVLFADVADSTPLGERLDPESLRRVMSRFFERMSVVLERHGGTVEKFIGDAVMAVFGIPELHEDDGLRAVRAATELRQALATLNDELDRELGVRIGIRVGINTGEVVAGDGSGGQMLVTGDAVNVAKRLEESARTGEILVGEPTRRLVENAVVLEPRDELELKGKALPHAAWNVLAVIEGASAYARRLDAPLIGREHELQTLRAVYADAVAERACRLFTVVGPAGIGKSRLTAELCASLRGKATIVTGRCLAYGDGITFWPLVEIVGALGSDEGVREIVAGVEDAELVATRILGAVGTNPAVPGGETFWAVRRLFEELARRQPLVVVVEDIHWAEPTLLDLLEYLAGWTYDAPLLLLCLARPDLLDERPGWLTQPGTGVVLDPLTDEQARALLDEIGQEWPLDAAARAHITEAAEGNPLYLEQMAAMLAEGAPTHGIPPTIQALIAARLDRLPPNERTVLESAAVAGKHFVRSALRKLLAETDQSLVDAALLSLARKDLLTARPGREDAYRFRHALIRDAAYAGVSKELRAQLHARFADWAVNTSAGKAGDLDEIVGYHLEQAVRYRQQLGPLDAGGVVLAQRAADILGAAGRRAFAREDAPAAVNLLDRAVALATDEQPAKLDLSRELGLALWSLGEVARAEALLNGIVEAAAAAGDKREEWHALLEHSAMRSMVDPERSHDTLEIAEEAIRVFGELGDELGLARSWRALGLEHRRRGHLGESEQACERALEHAVRAGDRREESRSADQLCTALLYGPAEATAALTRCEAMLVRAGANPLLEANVRASIAGLHGMLGDFDEARAAAKRAETIYVDLGLRLALAGLTQVAGPIELLAGDAQAAETILRRGYDILHEIGATGDSDALLAEALYAQARYDEARMLVEGAMLRTSEADVAPRVLLLGLRAKLRARSDDEGDAEATAAIALAESTDALNLRGDAFANLAETHRLLGDDDRATAAAVKAVELYTRKGNRSASARLQALRV